MAWTSADDAKLPLLFKRGPNGNGIRSSDLKPKYIHEVITRFFPDRKYDSFAQLLRTKARAFQLNQELTGARKNSEFAAACQHSCCCHSSCGLIFSQRWLSFHFSAEQSEEKLEEESSDDEDFNSAEEEEEDISLGNSFVDEDGDNDDDDEEEEEEEEESNKKMPPKKKPIVLATPPRKKKAAAVDDAATSANESLQKMSLRSDKAWSFVSKWPYMMVQYMKNGCRHLCVELLVPTRMRKDFKVDTDGSSLSVAEAVPSFFYDKERPMTAYADDQAFNEDSHKATAFEDIVQEVSEDTNFEDVVWAEPMKLTLPFQCDNEFVDDWELLRFFNEDEDLTDELGGQQFYTILSVEYLLLS